MAVTYDGQLFSWGDEKARISGPSYVKKLLPEKLLDGIASINGSLALRKNGTLCILNCSTTNQYTFTDITAINDIKLK